MNDMCLKTTNVRDSYYLIGGIFNNKVGIISRATIEFNMRGPNGTTNTANKFIR